MLKWCEIELRGIVYVRYCCGWLVRCTNQHNINTSSSSRQFCNHNFVPPKIRSSCTIFQVFNRTNCLSFPWLVYIRMRSLHYQKFANEIMCIIKWIRYELACNCTFRFRALTLLNRNRTSCLAFVWTHSIKWYYAMRVQTVCYRTINTRTHRQTNTRRISSKHSAIGCLQQIPTHWTPHLHSHKRFQRRFHYLPLLFILIVIYIADPPL